MRKASVHLTVATLLGVGFGLAIASKVGAQGKPLAYYVTQLDVTGDPDLFAKQYGARVTATLEPFGGRFLVRGASAHALEGDKPRSRNAVIVFDNIDKARAWYNSTEYQSLIPVRQRFATTISYLVEGVPK